MNLLETTKLVKSYNGRTVVVEISFVLSQQEIVGLLGRNGAGKTTTFRMILGMIVPGRVDRHFQEGFLDDMPYDVPNYLVDYPTRVTHVPVGFWRCVNHTQNCFFRERFIDELAHAAGQDPYRYRRRLLRSHPAAVLRACGFTGMTPAWTAFIDRSPRCRWAS